MKIVVIGDIHGRDTWKKIVRANPKADKFVFIGDYFDSFDISNALQMYNFKEIIIFKLENPDKVVLLLGNHDYHYMRGTNNYKGHQNIHQWDIQEIVEPYIKDGTIQLAWSHDKYLFTHAGVSNTWCLNWNINTNNIVEELNYMLLRYPKSLEFQGVDQYGDNTTQGPIWIRPDSLTKDALNGWIHIVGHTASFKIKYYPFTIGYNTVTVDSLGHGNYLLIDTDQSEPLIEKQIIEEITILSKFYPSTVLIVTGDTLYIVEWYTVENEVDKYFLYEIDRKYLKPYIEKRLPHLDMIRQGKLFYMFDSNEYRDLNNEFNIHYILNKKPLRFKQLPKDCLPKQEAYFDRSYIDFVNIKRIEQLI